MTIMTAMSLRLARHLSMTTVYSAALAGPWKTPCSLGLIFPERESDTAMTHLLWHVH